MGSSDFSYHFSENFACVLISPITYLWLHTRHTCISLLSSAGVNERIVKKIVGHKGQGVTQVVYTHFEIVELIDAINKI